MSGIRLGRNTSRRRLPPLVGDARIPPPVRAPAPFPPCVSWRASCTCPFLRCAFRAPYGEQGGGALRFDCTENCLCVYFVDLLRMAILAILIGRDTRTLCENGAILPSCAIAGRSGLEGRRHEAEAVTAGDADGGKRDAADPAKGGIPTEPGDGRPRRMRTRRPAGIRQSRRCADPTDTRWLSADRMCWAGNAAAVSRTRAGWRDAWRWTRLRRQSGDCRVGRGRSQAPSATGG